MKNAKFNKLLATAVKMEGKKSSIKIGDGREFMAILKKLCLADVENLQTVLQYLSSK